MMTIMSIEIIVALITFIGVVASVIAHIYINKRMFRNEFLKIKTSTEQVFTSTILPERQKRYPSIYRLISSFARHLEMMEKELVPLHPIVDGDQVKVFLRELESADADHALFFSIETSYAMRDLRIEVYRFLKTCESPIAEITTVMLVELRNRIGVVEVCLKKDIGVLIDEFQDIRSLYTQSDYDHFFSIKKHSKEVGDSEMTRKFD